MTKQEIEDKKRHIGTFRNAAEKREKQLNSIPLSLKRKLPKNVFLAPSQLREHADNLEKHLQRDLVKLANNCLKDLAKYEDFMKREIDKKANEEKLPIIINGGCINYGIYCFIGSYDVGTYYRNINYLRGIEIWRGTAIERIAKIKEKYPCFCSNGDKEYYINFNSIFQELTNQIIGFKINFVSLQQPDNFNGKIKCTDEYPCVGYGVGYCIFGKKTDGKEYFINISEQLKKC